MPKDAIDPSYAAILQADLLAKCRLFLADRAEKAPFFHPIRQKSCKLFAETMLPRRKDEAYRYTPLIKALSTSFPQGIPLHKASSPEGTDHLLPGKIESYELICWNGRLLTTLEKRASWPFQALSLRDGYVRAPALFATYFNAQAASTGDPWVMLNSVLFEEGCWLYIPPHTKLAKPIVIHHHIDMTLPAALWPRTLLILGEGSSATLFERFRSRTGAPPAFVNHVSELLLETGSQLTYYPTYIDPTPSHQLRYTYVQQAEKSAFAQYFTAASCHGSLVRDETQIHLRGAEASTTLRGIYQNHGRGHLALHTAVHHDTPETSTNQYYRGSGEDSSTTLFDGAIHIAPKSQQVVAHQQHKGWLLSDQATIHARPQLSIEADEVVCSHGSTTLQADPKACAYLQGRGIPAAQAEKMLLQAFFEEGLREIPDEPIQHLLRRSLKHMRSG